MKEDGTVGSRALFPKEFEDLKKERKKENFSEHHINDPERDWLIKEILQ